MAAGLEQLQSRIKLHIAFDGSMRSPAVKLISVGRISWANLLGKEIMTHERPVQNFNSARCMTNSAVGQ
jgi:hypothetical protein